MHPQEEANERSLRSDRSSYWDQHADQVTWFSKPSATIKYSTKTLPSGNSHPHWQWFPDGELNTCYNCVDRHVKRGNGEQPAIFWHSEVANGKEVYSYQRLLEEVEALAGVLRNLGVRKGDTVVIYIPMISQALIASLAAARLGAIHAVVFGGFGANALAQRIDSANPKVMLTTSCGLESATKIVDYQPMVRGALKMSKAKPNAVLVWNRPQHQWPSGVDKASGEIDWDTAVAEAKKNGVKAECARVRSEDGLYIIYTSGTTGAPKGVLRQNGGHAVGVLLSTRETAAIQGPGDVVLGVSDIGWVTGHTYVLYGPLLAGATTLLHEGKPVGTPDAGIIWRLVQQYKVNTIFAAPTALRAIRRADPSLELLHKVGQEGGLKGLRSLWLTGERSQPGIVQTFGDLVTRYAAKGAIINDNYGLSEQGGPLSTHDLIPSCSLDAAKTTFTPGEALTVTPGCAGKPMPGMDLHVVDDEGNEVPRGTMGNVVLGLPLSPSSFRTLWRDEERFYTSYLQRFSGKWFDTGDAGLISKDGAIEQAIASHDAVAECCVIGTPDELKGHLPFAFVVTFSPQDESKLFAELQKEVRSQQGSISSLGGMISAKQGENLIPKTRSGKMLRRNLRELVENAAKVENEKEVQVPATIEDPAAIDAARKAIKEYYDKQNARTKSRL
ncbi:hypothetical protein LTR37_018204 [Vermiconidia calcicola]|uniref:Uncharacterized protein n=1 Tax=Vermiconidia calcicola TaxID=1690605 RepID=A0ACC3MHU2_9PEZI|nr:hypothetical protein LTR37_018204 [Vermiconidia calcicola]